MEVERLAPRSRNGNMPDYEQAYRNFSWEQVEKELGWDKRDKVNAGYEIIDRHVAGRRGNKVALYYIDDFREERYTFLELKLLSDKFANVLRKLGIKRGDLVALFLPRSPELYVCFLGIAKAGAIAQPLFEAFMAGALRDRLQDSEATAIVTVPPLKDRIPRGDLPHLEHVILVGAKSGLEPGEESFEREMSQAPEEFDVEWLDKEEPLILHYTSGSTGKPKGVLHVQRALIGHYQTGKWVLDLRDDDIYWCTSDPGWVTGTSYGIYGPWANGASIVVRGGRFSVEGWYSTIEKYRITVWYTAPTALRLLMASGEEVAREHDLSSLRLICSVGEPLNPEVIRWGVKVFAQPIHDTWWMTETGMQLIANYPSMSVKLGSMGRPFPGVQAAVIDDRGNELSPLQIGNLAIKSGWPAMMKGIWGNEEKYRDYFKFAPWFVSGDSAYRDEEGYFWFQGRVDDIIKTSGERVGPFEVESKLLEHPAVAEAGVIGKPDPVRGEIIKAFVSLREGYGPSPELKQELFEFVQKGLAAHAAPREMEFRDKLPRTRSGKIMRRVLKAWELGLPTGDLSTMED